MLFWSSISFNKTVWPFSNGRWIAAVLPFLWCLSTVPELCYTTSNINLLLKHQLPDFFSSGILISLLCITWWIRIASFFHLKTLQKEGRPDMITDIMSKVFSKNLDEEFWKDLTNGFTIRSPLYPSTFVIIALKMNRGISSSNGQDQSLITAKILSQNLKD